MDRRILPVSRDVDETRREQLKPTARDRLSDLDELVVRCVLTGRD